MANKGFARHPEPEVVFDRLTEDGCYYHVRFYAWPGRIDDGICRSMMLTALHDVILQNGFDSPVQQLEMQPPPDLDFSFGEKGNPRGSGPRAPSSAKCSTTNRSPIWRRVARFRNFRAAFP